MSKRKKLVRTIDLHFFQDDANGEWGVTHKETCPGSPHLNGDETFNAFWDGQGLFHDVFEHAHEITDEFFRGNAALNVGGEVAAMGQMLYYIGQLHLDRFPGQQLYRSPTDNAMQITLGMMKEAIANDSSNFGYALESNVPKQEETPDNELEWVIDEHFAQIQATEVYDSGGKYPDEETRCREYKESVTLEKLQNLYRYGWRMGEKLTGGLMRNHNVLQDFIGFWSQFCKANDAEEMARAYKAITFKVYKDSEGLLSWSAVFIPENLSFDERAKQVTIRGTPDDTFPKMRYLVQEWQDSTLKNLE